MWEWVPGQAMILPWVLPARQVEEGAKIHTLPPSSNSPSLVPGQRAVPENTVQSQRQTVRVGSTLGQHRYYPIHEFIHSVGRIRRVEFQPRFLRICHTHLFFFAFRYTGLGRLK